MKNITSSGFLASCLCLLSLTTLHAQATLSSQVEKTIPKKMISEEQFVMINGIQQWVTIKGEGSKPVILFLHGGPGSPLSPFSDAIYGKWEQDFILVQWDHRGSGRTFGRNAPAELTPEYLKANPLTVDQVVSDGIAVTEYLKKNLGKQKIILFGTSWGSVPGIKMAAKRPDLFAAYVGHSQLVSPADGLKKAYAKVQQMAERDADAESLKDLSALGAPPYTDARSTGKLMRIIKKYERLAETAAPASWMKLPPPYDDEKEVGFREQGDDYSFVNYTGDKKLGIQGMAPGINLLKDNMAFSIPVYFIQGEEDILTPKESTKEYFDKIQAPQKKYRLLAKTAHGFNQAVLEAQYSIFKEISK